MERVGIINRENIDLTGGKQVRVPVTRQKCHCPRYKEILDGYNDFRNYVVVGSLKATTNFGRSNVHHIFLSEASKVVSRIHYNDKNTTLS